MRLDAILKDFGRLPARRPVLRLDDFEFEGKFLTAKDRGQVKLPKLSREAKRRPALIKVDQKLDS